MSAGNTTSNTSKHNVSHAYNVSDLSNKQDVGSLPGVKWTLSSHKPGAGVAALRDPDLRKLWQSDGTQPHVVDIQFPRRTAVTHVSIYLDTTQDDSYTPTNIGIKAGTYFHDLVEVRRRDLDSPKGWTHFALSPHSSEAAEEESPDARLPPPIWTYHLQVNVYANHLNGKDTHLRSIRVFGPPAETNMSKDKITRGTKTLAQLRSGQDDKYEALGRRYDDAFDVLAKISNGRTEELQERFDFDLDEDAENVGRNHVDPGSTSASNAAQLPPPSRDLFLSHRIR